MRVFMKTLITLSMSCLLLTTANGQLTTSSTIPSDDLQITYPGNTTNNGTSMQTRVTTASTDFRRIAIKFDITSMGIPADAVIVSANLVLTPVGTESTTSMVLRRITTTTWSEASATLNPATTTTNQVFTSGGPYTGPATRTIDVTNLVKDIFSGVTTNNGWLISCSPESATTAGNIYHSLSSGTITAQPKLNISWYVPYSITGATINHASSTVAADGSVAVTFSGGSGNPNSTFQWYYSNGTPLGSSSSGTTVPTLPNRAYGWYGLKIKGAYDSLYTAFLVGVDCDIVSISFAPGPEYIDDAYLDFMAGPSTPNNGGYVYNMASRAVGIPNSNSSLIRFRLWMDANSKPLQSNLTMVGSSHIYANGPNTANLDQVTQNWQEYIVKVSTAPTTSTTIQANLPTTTTSNQNQVVDLNAFWNYWKANNLLNYGMRLQPIATAYTMRQRFHSSDATTPSNRPKIDFIIDDATCDRTTYTLFKREQDAGTALMFQGKLKFYFVEEYQIDPGKKIPLSLYDENNVLIAAIDINGGAISGKPLLPAFNYMFDDNRQVLNLTSYGLTPGKYYILQLTHDNGTKEYIKFIYTN